MILLRLALAAGAALAALATAAAAPTASGPALPDSLVFRCETTAEEYRGVFELYEDGGLYLHVRKGDRRFTCPLELHDLSWSPDSVVGNMTLRMTPRECRDGKGRVEDRPIMKEMSLVVRLHQQLEADAQWIRYLQPSPCAVDRFDREALREAAARFDARLRR